jgi:hypothetical protein
MLPCPSSNPSPQDSTARSTVDMGSMELLGIADTTLSTSDMVLSTPCVVVRYRSMSTATRRPTPPKLRHPMALDCDDSQDQALAH